MFRDDLWVKLEGKHYAWEKPDAPAEPEDEPDQTNLIPEGEPA
jgi:hypothetical protein